MLVCPTCKSTNLIKSGKYQSGGVNYQRYHCRDCRDFPLSLMDTITGNRVKVTWEQTRKYTIAANLKPLFFGGMGCNKHNDCFTCPFEPDCISHISDDAEREINENIRLGKVMVMV